MAAHILITEDDLVNQRLHKKVIQAAGYQVSLADDGLQALELVEKQSFDLIILDVMMPNLDGYETCRRLRQIEKTAQVPILMLTSLDSIENKIKGFEAGADDYLSKPYEPDELIARVKVLLRRVTKPVSPTKTLKDGKVIAGFSLRGGVGVSTIMANLAASLTQLWDLQVALVDLTLIAGQAALLFDLPIRNTWADLVHMSNQEIDHEVLGLTMRSHPSGVHVLSSPQKVQDAERIDVSKVERVFTLLCQGYDYVLLDLPHNFAATTLAGLDMAKEILLVLTPELASVRATAMALDVFDTLDYSRNRIRLILNWVFEQHGLPKNNIENGLGQEVDLVIPHAADHFIRAINLGMPPVLDQPDSPLGALFGDLAYYVSKEEHKKKRPQNPTEAWKRLAKRMRKRRGDK